MGSSRFQFSLRAVLGVIALVAFSLSSGMRFGVAVTATVLFIVVASFLLSSRIPQHRRSPSVCIAVCAVTMLAIYLGSFVAFRVFRTYEFSLAPADDPQHNLVVFSLEPSVQQLARDVYSPLIRLFPAHCYYPDRHDMQLLNHDPFTGERIVLY
jgi:hypothetical protein